MKHRVRRTTGGALVLAVATVLFAPPAAADPVTPTAGETRGEPRSIAALSPASLKFLRAAPAGARMQDSPVAPRAFFKTPKGALAIGLIAAGVGFTVWSINHDRKPVRSPIR